MKTRGRRRGLWARVRTTRALARALLRGRVADAGDPRRWFVLVALLMVGCGAEGEVGGEGEESGDGSESGMETDASGATSPPTDQDDPAAATPLPGADGNPAEGVVGLPDGGVTADGAVPGADGQVAADLEELTTRRVPAGTRIRVTVDYEISTDLYQPGDAVVATVAEDVADPSGEVLIPRGVKLLGRILTSAGSPGLDEPPILEMVFETLSALNAEWPVEGAVINVPVVVDPRADIARRFQRNRSGDREVPGRILEGAVVVVELRAGVRVGPIVGPEIFPWDTLPGWDTLPRVDTLPGLDALPTEREPAAPGV